MAITTKQPASGSAVVTQVGSYQYTVKLCSQAGGQELCSSSVPMTITVTSGTGPVISDCSATSADVTCFPHQRDPVKLQVKGWPEYLAMGSITDNNTALNQVAAVLQQKTLLTMPIW
jgi:hypothetical protein